MTGGWYHGIRAVGLDRHWVVARYEAQELRPTFDKNRGFRFAP